MNALITGTVVLTLLVAIEGFAEHVLPRLQGRRR